MAGFSSVTGDEAIMFADNASFDGTQRGGKITTDGQLWIGSTASPHVKVGTLTPGTGISITNGSGAITIASTVVDGITGIAGDTGGTATGPVVTLDAHTNCGSTVEFVRSSNTISLNVTDPAFLNTCIGLFAGNLSISGGSNTCVGDAAFFKLSSGSFNCAYGNDSLGNLTTGSRNVCFGRSTGLAFTTESDNIMLGDNVVSSAGVSNTLRIGRSTGTGSSQINQAFISGIVGNSSSNTELVTINSSTDQLGVITTGTSGQVLTSNGTGVNPSFQTPPASFPSNIFLSYLSSGQSNVTGGGATYDIVFDQAPVNQNSVYNTGTGIFTAPATGIYQFIAQCFLFGFNSGNTDLSLTFVSSVSTNNSPSVINNPFSVATAGGGAQLGINASYIASMTAGDTMKVQIFSSTGTQTISLNGTASSKITFFQGYQIG